MTRVITALTGLLVLVNLSACFGSKEKDPEATRLETNIKLLENEETALQTKLKAAGTDVEIQIPLQHQLEDLKSRRERIREVYRSKTGTYPPKEGK